MTLSPTQVARLSTSVQTSSYSFLRSRVCQSQSVHPFIRSAQIFVNQRNRVLSQLLHVLDAATVKRLTSWEGNSTYEAPEDLSNDAKEGLVQITKPWIPAALKSFLRRLQQFSK
jgi:hypothetical protein